MSPTAPRDLSGSMPVARYAPGRGWTAPHDASQEEEGHTSPATVAPPGLEAPVHVQAQRGQATQLRGWEGSNPVVGLGLKMVALPLEGATYSTIPLLSLMLLEAQQLSFEQTFGRGTGPIAVEGSASLCRFEGLESLE
jgi:hypothetical protein